MATESKIAAQMRVDRIASFNEELQYLEQEKVLELTDEQLQAIADYQDNVFYDLSEQFDVDINRREKQLTFGMRIASLLGALALAVSVFFLFYQYWGLLSTSIQIGILMSAPVASLFATLYASTKEKSRYFTKLLALVCFACFVLNVVVLGQIYNITPSDNAFIAWAALAFLLAYSCDVRLLLVAGILCVGGFISARVGVWSGLYWIHFGMRPENFFVPSLLFFLLPFYLPHNRFTGFHSMYRVFGLLGFFIPVLILAYAGNLSYMYLDEDIIEGFYTLLGFIASAGLIVVGIRNGLTDVIYTANAVFIFFLYTKIYVWWWDWMPKYMFFLIVGLIAVLILFIFKRLRGGSRVQLEEVPA